MNTIIGIKRVLECYDKAMLEIPRQTSEKWKMYYLGQKNVLADLVISVFRYRLYKFEEDKSETNECD